MPLVGAKPEETCFNAAARLAIRTIVLGYSEKVGKLVTRREQAFKEALERRLCRSKALEDPECHESGNQESLGHEHSKARRRRWKLREEDRWRESLSQVLHTLITNSIFDRRPFRRSSSAKKAGISMADAVGMRYYTQ